MVLKGGHHGAWLPGKERARREESRGGKKTHSKSEPGRGDGVEARPLLRRERGTVSALVPAGNGHINSKTVLVAGERKDELKENVPTRYRNCIFDVDFVILLSFVYTQISFIQLHLIYTQFWSVREMLYP